MSEPRSIATALQRITAWFEAHAPEHTPEFAPPVLGVEGPLGELFAAAGGQQDREDVFDYHSLLSPEEGVRERAVMDELARNEPWPESWWHPSWVPFASDLAGQLLVVDERTGEVISFIHDDEPREVLAPSLYDYFDGIATELETGVRVYDERYGVVLADELERLITARAKLDDRGPEPSQVGFYLATASFVLAIVAVAYVLDL